MAGWRQSAASGRELSLKRKRQKISAAENGKLLITAQYLENNK